MALEKKFTAAMLSKYGFFALATTALVAGAIAMFVRPAGNAYRYDQEGLTHFLNCCSSGLEPRIDEFAHRLDGVRSCSEAGSKPPEKWIRHEQKRPWATLDFYLPDYCHKQLGFRWDHGGEQWACDQIQVEIAWGHWGTDSFDGPACQAVQNGISVMHLQEPIGSTTSAMAWHLTGWRHNQASVHELEPIISASSPDLADEDMVRQIAKSAEATLKEYDAEHCLRYVEDKCFAE